MKESGECQAKWLLERSFAAELNQGQEFSGIKVQFIANNEHWQGL
jgi:hypothetical protein